MEGVTADSQDDGLLGALMGESMIFVAYGRRGTSAA
jgi:hypothetical protein